MTSWERTKHTLSAQETAARPLLSRVLVYGQHEPLNKAKSQADDNRLSKRQSEGQAVLNEVQCQPFTCFLWGSQVDGAAPWEAAVKEEGGFFHT